MASCVWGSFLHLDIALVIQVDLPLHKVAVGLVANAIEKTAHSQFPFLICTQNPD